VLLDTTLPEIHKTGIIRDECPGILDTANPAPPVVEDQEPPAPVVTADLGTCQVHGAPGLPCPRLVAEEGAGVREFFKDAFVIE